MMICRFTQEFDYVCYFTGSTPIQQVNNLRRDKHLLFVGAYGMRP